VMLMSLPIILFFFSSRRRHTRSTRDWSSDVCSSDLARRPAQGAGCRRTPVRRGPDGAARRPELLLLTRGQGRGVRAATQTATAEIGRASCREKLNNPAEDSILERNAVLTNNGYHRRK